LLAAVAAPLFAQDKQALEALRARIERLRQGIASAEEEKNEASDQLRASEKAISDANRALRRIGAEQDAARRDLRAYALQRGRTETELAARQTQLARLLSTRYRVGEQGFLRLALAGSDPNRAARELHYYGYVSRAQADFIRVLRGGIAHLADLENQSREKDRELAELATRQRDERRQLLTQKTERRRVLARIQGQIRGQRREVKSLRRNESRLARLIEEIGKIIAPPRSGRRNDKIPESGQGEGQFARLKGKLRLPIKGNLTNRYGTPRAEGGPSWRGLFIRSEPGQEVRAVAAGRVVFADWLRGFGNLLILDHGQSYLSIYGNNEATLKQVGEEVKMGETIATVGASGGSLESGLYFETRHQGKAFDPLSWVSLK
jgi:septal ring factor EnvC (AmiA/AmiB activator)